MAEKERGPIEKELPKLSDESVGYLSKFREGMLGYRLPTSPIEIKNFGKLFESGVIALFAMQSQCIVDPKLEMYFTDDFSKICLREIEKREALISVGIGHDNSGAIDMRVIAKNEVLSPIPKNEVGFITLGYVLQGVVCSSGYKIQKQ